MDNFVKGSMAGYVWFAFVVTVASAIAREPVSMFVAFTFLAVVLIEQVQSLLRSPKKKRRSSA
jgi:hypothetical protein